MVGLKVFLIHLNGLSNMKVLKLITEITGVSGFPTKGVLGRKYTLTGTFSSSGKVVTGTDTLFKSEIGSVKGWLYSTTDNEVRSFIQINGDNVLELEQAFTNDQTNENLVVYYPQYASIGARSSHLTVAAQFNKRTFPAGMVKNISSEGGVEPVTYDAGSGEITFDLAY